VNPKIRKYLCLSVFATMAAMAVAQNAAETADAVPSLVNYSSVLKDGAGRTVNSITGVTFLIYKDEQGGAPLWLETQNVTPDETGRYSVQLGATTSSGLPSDIFQNGQARWLAVQPAGEAEQARSLLVAVPYAMKAQDAQTLGGLPASAFALAGSNGSAGASADATASKSSAANTATKAPPPSSGVTTNGGTAGKIPMFSTSTDIENSVIAQKDGFIGIGTSSPTQALEVLGSSTSGSGIQSVAVNKSTKTASYAVVAAESSGSGGVTAELVTDGLGTAVLKTPGGYIGTYTNQPFGFITDNTERMRILTSGVAAIGTTTPSGDYQLEVNTVQPFETTIRNAVLGTGLSAANTSGEAGGLGVEGDGGAGDPSSAANGGAGVVGIGGVAGNASVGGADGAGGSFTGASFTVFGDGVDGIAGSGYAGNFTGNLNVSGAITAGTKDFKLDHPLDPANKYLFHASVESSEMMDIYSGNVTTDGEGRATVPLPAWFEALNTDFRYQLTVIGQFAQAIVEKEIAGHQFSIRSSAPNVKVSWQVTAVRHDAFAKANPLVVEQEKEPRLKGYYIHPELYGAAPERQIEWARHPQMMKHVQERELEMKQRPAKLAASTKP